MKPHFDIVVYCPLESEFREVYNIFGFEEDLTDDFNILSLRSICNGVSLLIVAGDDMGIAPAQSAAALIYEKCNFTAFICLGIAGSISADVQIGDVCYSGKVLDISQNQKFTDQGAQFSTTPFRTSSVFTNSLNFFRKHPHLERARNRWQSRCEDSLARAKLKGTGIANQLSAPQSHVGTIITGPVAAGQKIKSQIKDIDRKALAIETEVGGIFTQFERLGDIHVMTIRGISDAADENKSKLEIQTGGSVRIYAVQNAANFLKVNLEHNGFFRKLFTRDSGPKSADKTSAADNKIEDALEKAVLLTRDRFRYRLAMTSPDYRDRDLDYWIPAPRLIARPSVMSVSRPTDVEEVLENDPHVLVQIPLGYPDRSAPHVFAIQLISTVLAGRIAIPIHINSESVAPPRTLNSFASDFSKLEIDSLMERDDCILIFIFESLPFGNERRLNHIISELSNNKNCLSLSFVDPNDFEQNADSRHFSFFAPYQLDAVSFVNIARYIKRQFGIENIQAESIALRLSNTFKAFELPVHPSYFAGIPRNFLTKLIEANRRAELIELAVTGFLTFAVAEDKSDVRLSRTTRKRFLMDILARMEIEGETFSAERLLDVARDTLIEHDFDVDANIFVGHFFDFGILALAGNNVEFSVPFIKSFLLAELLAKDEEKARKYFNIDMDHFDFMTFSIYCEICGGRAIFDRISTNIKNIVSDFDTLVGTHKFDRTEERHALVDSEIGPKILRRQSAIGDLQRKFQQQMEKILASDDDSERKQELLDIQAIAKASAHEQQNEHVEADACVEGRREVVRALYLARTLLGGGAEHLNAEQKRSLAKDIIRLTSLIVNDWYRCLAENDYDVIAKSVFRDIRPKILERYTEAADEDIMEFSKLVVTAAEFYCYMNVIPTLLYPLDDVASHPVLAKTLENLDIDSRVEDVFRSLWLVSVKEKSGDKRLRRLIKRLPKRAFTRVSVADYIVGRAYWSSIDQDERVSLLALAEEIMMPVGVKVANDSG